MKNRARTRRRWLLAGGVMVIVGGIAAGGLIPATMLDFHLSGTQIGDVYPPNIRPSVDCIACHGPFEPDGGDPYGSWSSSKMAYAGKNPLFYAQMTLANQDVDNAGYFCMRCHVPMSFVTGNALDPSGDSLTHIDRDGVNCHFCHSMVDPIYKPGISPPEDEAILAALDNVPQHYGNAMFVLDPDGDRRSTRLNYIVHGELLYSPFHTTGDMCGTCHDVGNVAVSRLPDGTYRYNALNEPVPDEDPHTQFPLERTYSEWKLSAYANGGVDMGGRFGGDHPTGVMESCRDCHMPRTEGKSSFWGQVYPDLARHDFAGAGVWTFDILAIYLADDPWVEPEALAHGRAHALSMLQRAVSLEVSQSCSSLNVRVINEAGHKLPTGHIEGRRAWVNVRFYDKWDQLIAEHGGYDHAEAELDEASTTIYEMHVGLSEDAAKVTGLPPGPTTHMVLADTIEKDTRIPPRGFNNAAFEAAGAPVVGAMYADGQHWDDLTFGLPPGAARAEVTANYQMVTRHYIEALRDGNHTDTWGDIVYDLWLQTDKAPPIAMASQELALCPPRPADLNCSGTVDVQDLLILLSQWGPCPRGASRNDGCPADLNGSGAVDVLDLLILLSDWG